MFRPSVQTCHRSLQSHGRWLGSLLLFLAGLCVGQAALVFQEVRSFGFADQSGRGVNAPVIAGSDGALYGTTKSGGSVVDQGWGTVFRVNKDGSDYRVLHRFLGSAAGDGINPRDPVLEGTDGALYGTARDLVYRLNKDGTGYQVIHHLEGPIYDFSSLPRPPSSLAEGPDGFLYGATYAGGSGGGGTIYRLRKDGTDFEIIHSFSEADGNGKNPWGSLVLGSDGALYGTAAGGFKSGFRLSGSGAFRMERDGTGYTILHVFGASSLGPTEVPSGLLLGSDGALYGTTSSGVLFAMNQDGTGYREVREGAWSNATPYEASDGFLYVWSAQELIRVSRDGTELSVLGPLPGVRGLVEDSEGALYCTAAEGGQETLFSVDKEGASHRILHKFWHAGGDGTRPSAFMEASDHNLYGTTASGGSDGKGTVFGLGKNGTGYHILHSFGGSADDGENPQGAIVEGADGTLYGTTLTGGANDYGTIYRLENDGSGYAVLHHFVGIAQGVHPRGLLMASDSLLYGVTQGGGFANLGTVFRIHQDGTSHEILRHFTFSETNERTPQGLLEGSDGVLYGTTAGDGTYSGGSVFRMNRDGSDYSLLRNFAISGVDARNPRAPLIEGSDGFLYGTTRDGGSAGLGTVFRLSKEGMDYSILRSFLNDGRDPLRPEVALVEGSDSVLYGTTASGGQGYGTLFRMNKAGGSYVILMSFAVWQRQRRPETPLVFGSDNRLYGTTATSGSLYGGDQGSVFSLFNTRPPTAADDSMERVWGTSIRLPIVRLLSNDTDPQNSKLDLSDFASLSAQGAAIIRSGEQLVYTPPAGFNDQDSFTYGITNLYGDRSVGSVTVTIGTEAAFTSAERIDGVGFRLVCQGVPGNQYALQAADNLGPLDWVTLGVMLAGTDGQFAFTDLETDDRDARFYRLAPVP